MTTLAKLARYREALEKHARAPWASVIKAPTPEDYHLTTPQERFMAGKVEREVLKTSAPTGLTANGQAGGGSPPPQ